MNTNDIYEVKGYYNELQQLLLEAETDEDRQCILDTVEMLDDDIESKVRYYYSIIQNATASAKACGDEIDRLRKLKANHEKAVESLRGRIKDWMTAANMKRIDAGIFKVSLRKTKRVEVYDLEKLDEQFIETTISKKPRKKDIKDFLELGMELEGATLVEDTSVMMR